MRHLLVRVEFNYTGARRSALEMFNNDSESANQAQAEFGQSGAVHPVTWILELESHTGKRNNSMDDLRLYNKLYILHVVSSM